MKQATLILSILLLATLACSSIDDVIGQRPGVPTPTIPPFSTATPGGRISVWMITPTGGAPGVPSGGGSSVGEVIPPAATATAAFATLQAATAMANATISVPLFQPNDCPAEASPLPPPQPTSFNQFPQAIGLYLSAGGPPQLLEAMLRTWGSVAEGAVVQADTDLTGDGINEIIVTVYDPTYYRPGVAAPGQMLVYGCSQRGYRLLFSTTYSPLTMLPELKRVGDMNGDFRAELVFAQRICTSTPCTQTVEIMAWNSTLGTFNSLNNAPIPATNGRVAIHDPDNDGVLELSVTFNPISDFNAGPPRKSTDFWDWEGELQQYLLAISELDRPVYRIHAVHDADAYLLQGDWRSAVRMYTRVRDDANLQPWSLPNEAIMLRAYATYKMVLAQIDGGQRRNAANVLATLEAENPPGSAGNIYAILGQTFLQNYNRNRDRKRACDVTLAAAATRPDILILLNSYGYGNPGYKITDLCPFLVK